MKAMVNSLLYDNGDISVMLGLFVPTSWILKLINAFQVPSPRECESNFLKRSEPEKLAYMGND